LIVAVAAAGCSYNRVLEFEPDVPFQGLAELLDNGPGPTDPRQLNVVFVHGMGHHPFGELGIRVYQKRIAGELGSTPDDAQSVDWGALCPPVEKRADFSLALKREGSTGLVTERELLHELAAEQQAVCPLRINEVIVGYVGWRQYRDADALGGRALNLFELSWDRATELLQKKLLELDEAYAETVELDENLDPLPDGRNRDADRVYVNRWLKKFVNRQLGDPVIYLGAYGDSIRQVAAEGLSKIAAVDGTNEDNPYAIISDSLGSRIVFDTLNCVLDPSDRAACEAPRISARRIPGGTMKLQRFSDNTVQVFMNANQLPFLAMGSVTAPEKGETETDWLKRFPCNTPMLPVKSQKKPQAVQVVAFTDSNDALSYHLTRRFRAHCSDLAGAGQSLVRFINVRISNAKWNYLFVLADPYKAHSDGFRENDAAIRLLVHGHEVE
jgi:hypothetical protein